MEIVTAAQTPLDKAIRVWHTRLPPSVLQRFLTGLRLLRDRFSCVNICTVFSGTDIAVLCAKRLVKFWSEHFEINVAVESAYACEIVAPKRKFIREQFPSLQTIFVEAAQLSQAKAFNDVIGKWEQVPGTLGLLGGFSCTSKSPQSSARSSHKNCIALESDTATSATWRHMRDAIAKHRPLFVIAENVEQFKEDGKDSSDLAQVLQWFRKNRYSAEDFLIEASHYGSFARRRRLYVVALSADVTFPADSMRFIKDSREHEGRG